VEFLSRVRLMHPEAVRMVFSGQQDFAAATAAINRGAVHKFLFKPLDAKAMRESLIEAFERYEHRETQ
jgi:FixJ family two-component response regulator